MFSIHPYTGFGVQFVSILSQVLCQWSRASSTKRETILNIMELRMWNDSPVVSSRGSHGVHRWQGLALALAQLVGTSDPTGRHGQWSQLG